MGNRKTIASLALSASILLMQTAPVLAASGAPEEAQAVFVEAADPSAEQKAKDLFAAQNAAVPPAGQHTADPAAAQKVTEPSSGQNAANPSDNPPVSRADARISREQAIELAGSYVDIPDGYELDSVSFRSGEGDLYSQPEWRLSFTKQVDDRIAGDINVSVNADTGQLLSFNIYDREKEQQASFPPKVDLEEAKAIADAYIRKMHPDLSGKLVFDQRTADAFKPPLQGNFTYPIQYFRLENGLAYEQNYIRLAIDGDGNILNYRYVWSDNVEFADPSGVIPEERAEAIMRQQEPRLVYRIPYRAPEQKPYIAYEWILTPVDALTGEPLYPAAASANEPLTKEPLAPLPEANGQLSKEEAVKIVQTHFPLPENAVLEDASYYEQLDASSGKERAYWNLRWFVKDESGDPVEDFWASVDSMTGIIRGFEHGLNRSLSNPAEQDQDAVKDAVSLSEVEEEAKSLVMKVLPFYSNQLVLVEQEERGEMDGQSRYRILFRRVIDGVLVNGEQVRLLFDAGTGSLIHFSNEISDVEYPQSKPQVISAGEAEELLLSLYDLKLQYEWTPKDEDDGAVPIEKIRLMIAAGEMPPEAAEQAVARPVYRYVEKYRDDSVFLDAESGVWRLADTGEETSLEKPEAADIDGHWAEHELRLMMEYDALDVKDGKVLPDQAITRGEMIKMLITAIQGGNHPVYFSGQRAASFADVAQDSAYFAYVETAVDLNLLDREEKQFRPSDPVSREELARLIVKALGYAKLAEVEGLFLLEAEDAAEIEHKGAAAIVTALGIMTLNGEGNFLPDQEVTRAQAAAAFYRFLQKREALRDNLEF